jgi:PAS domain S-box-containing protein
VAHGGERGPGAADPEPGAGTPAGAEGHADAGVPALLEALARAETLEAVVRALLDQARRLGAAAGSIFLRTAPDRLALLAAFGAGEAHAAPGEAIPLGAPIPYAEAVRTGRAVVLRDRGEVAARYPELAPVLEQRGEQAWITLPLHAGAGPVGALGLTFAGVPGPDASTPELLALIADLGGAALERARRLDAAQAARAEADRTLEVLRGRLAERERADEVLRAAYRRAEEHADLLEDVFQASLAGLSLQDASLRYLKVNPAFRAMTPRPDVDPVGRRLAEVWPPDAAADQADRYRAVLEDGAPLRLAGVECDFPDGSRHWFDLQVVRVRYHGEPTLLGALWETTDVVQARERAERSAGALDAVLASLPHGVAVYDERGALVRTNAAAEVALGYSRMGTVGLEERLRRFGLVHPDGRPTELGDWPVARALFRGETTQGEVFARPPAGPDGRPTWLAVSAAPIVHPSGERAGAVAAFLDVTREHELIQLREDLLRMVSHDLRTPLNAILAQAHLIRRTPALPAKVTERAEAVVRTCERMSGMIQDLLEMVLLESGHLTLRRTRLDLGAFLRELVERMRGPLGAGRVAVRVADPAPVVEADAARLERVVVNLLTNALKYSPTTTPVTVSAARLPDGEAAIEVADRGVGIAPEDVPRIFGRFYRAAHGRAPSGLGLGLYIARLLVEAHGGRIAVETAPGVGSRFTVRLPAIPAS